MIIFFLRIFQALKLSETELEESGRLSRLSALSDGEKRYVQFHNISLHLRYIFFIFLKKEYELSNKTDRFRYQISNYLLQKDSTSFIV